MVLPPKQEEHAKRFEHRGERRLPCDGKAKADEMERQDDASAMRYRGEDTRGESRETKLAFERLKFTPDNDSRGVIQGPHEKPHRHLVPEANHQKDRDIGHIWIAR